MEMSKEDKEAYDRAMDEINAEEKEAERKDTELLETIKA